MRPASAWLVVAAMAVAGVAAFAAPLTVVAALAVASVATLRTGRRAFLAFAVATLALGALLFALLLPGDPLWQAGPLRLGRDGLLLGLAGGLRTVAVLGANLALLGWAPPEPLLDGLGLPPRAVAFLAAVLLAAHDLGRDARRLATSRRLDGAWPRARVARAAAAAGLVAPLAVLALRRARVRAEALRLAGHDVGPRFAPLVAVTALAAAGRLALLAIPNVSLAYVVVFAGGHLFGARVGWWSGVLAMALTDLLVSGLAPVAFANAPAMGLVGLLGAALRPLRFAGEAGGNGWAGRLAAAACGLAATIVFSLAADVATWLAVPEYRGTPGALRALLLAGLAFNVVPAVTNAVLFAAAMGPLASAAREAHASAPQGPVATASA